jgi:hypothetical protein
MSDTKDSKVLTVEIINKGFTPVNPENDAYVDLFIYFNNNTKDAKQIEVIGILEDNYSENDTLKYTGFMQKVFPHNYNKPTYSVLENGAIRINVNMFPSRNLKKFIILCRSS